MENIATQLALIPWTEYVGKVVSIRNNVIILQVMRHVPIIVPPDLFRKSKCLINKGQDVGIFILDDGSIRIRPAQPQANQKEVITN